MNARKTGGKRLRELRRKRPTRTPSPLVLIVCEGRKTEKFYLNDMRRSRRLSTTHIEVIPGDKAGIHPKKIVEYAKEKKKNKDYNFTWCVFDRNQHENIHEAFVQAKANGIEVAFSNPCFELWYFLHFQDQRSAIDRRKLVKKLKKYIPDYEKGLEKVYEKVSHLQANASKRAKELRKMHQNIGKREAEKNPLTSVDILVEKLESIFSSFQKGR